MYVIAAKSQVKKTKREEETRIALELVTESLESFIEEATERVEKNTGYAFSHSEKMDILVYTIRKLEYVHRKIDYLPILFENELSDYVMRQSINAG